MNPTSEIGPATPSDEALLRRVQEQNLRQILSQLLHDLRNPVHSIRITMELFGRLARRTGDVEKLLERAAAYIGPAEAALNALLIINERFSTYLSYPSPPALAPLRVNDWLAEIAFLLRHSKRRLPALCSEVDPDWQLIADRPRLSHALLQYCFDREAPAQVTLAARSGPADLIHIDVAFALGQGRSGAPLDPPRFALEELRLLIENAGGTLAAHADTGISLSFKRSTG